jgi:hypothetical protein
MDNSTSILALDTEGTEMAGAVAVNAFVFETFMSIS